MTWKCWWFGHDWFTSSTVGQVTSLWETLPPYVFERDGCIVSAPPCQRCGAENPNAYGMRGDLWFHPGTTYRRSRHRLHAIEDVRAEIDRARDAENRMGGSD